MIDEFTKSLITEAANHDDGYFEYAMLIARRLPKQLHEQLFQLVKGGPIWDGDVISKMHRTELLSAGLAVRCCHKGEQGYTAATYLAYTVNGNIQDLRIGKVG